MKKVTVLLCMLVLMFLAPYEVYADSAAEASASSSSSVNANLSPSASASSSLNANISPSISSSAQIGDVNTSAQVGDVSAQVGDVSAKVSNISPSSSVNIHTYSKSKYVNRQFLHPPAVGIPSPMQPFLTPRQLSPAIWNYLPVIEGKWKKENEKKVVEVIEYKEHLYHQETPVEEVKVISNSKVKIVEGVLIGEIIIKGSKKTDSRELIMAAIDKLATSGANLVWIRINSIESKAISKYRGFVIGGSGGGVLLYEEKASLVGGTGVGRGTTTLEFQHFPVVQAVGYRAAKIEKIISEKTETEKEKIGNHRKEYEIIK